MIRAKSLVSSELAFYNAAADSLSDHTAHDKEGDPLSNDELMKKVAEDFLSKPTTCPGFLAAIREHYDQKSSSDRLIKVGRNITATINYADAVSGRDCEDPIARGAKTDASLRRLVEECKTLTRILTGDESRRVPTVRFGKTELQMPIVTLGCMRFQQSWNRPNPTVTSIDQVDKECQENLVKIIRYAVSMGVNHIETALGYGCSELQIGAALKTLFEAGEIKREDLIIQTKGGISSSTTPEQYRQTILDQLARLGLDYVDLFSVHGANTYDHYDWLYNHGETGNLIDVLRELKKEGKVRNIGFSTHAPVDVTRKMISEGDFDYLNLHHHFCGDYTASGDGEFGGNLENVRLANEKDMGVFIISAYDKGGRLYAPSNKLRDLTLPEFEPMEYGSMWLWHHSRLDEAGSQPHTIVCGAARPSDLDQPIYAALNTQTDETATKVDAVAARIRMTKVEELGEDWVKNWHAGVPNCSDAEQGTQIGNMVWLSNAIKVFGILDFAKDRYATLENNAAKWDYSKSKEDNVKAMGPGWPWMPGCAYDESRDYSNDLKDVPEENVAKVVEAMAFVHKYCSKVSAASVAGEEKKEEKKGDVPVEYETAYDMRPWTAYPERG